MTFEETTTLGDDIDAEAGPSSIVSNANFLACRLDLIVITVDQVAMPVAEPMVFKKKTTAPGNAIDAEPAGPSNIANKVSSRFSRADQTD